MDTAPFNCTATDLAHAQPLVALGLSPAELFALRRQGFVAPERRRGKLTYKLRFRLAGQQRVVYLGADEARVAEVRRAIALLQAAAHAEQARRQAVQHVAQQANAALRAHRARLAPLLAAAGCHWHGRRLRKTRCRTRASPATAPPPAACRPAPDFPPITEDAMNPEPISSADSLQTIPFPNEDASLRPRVHNHAAAAPAAVSPGGERPGDNDVIHHDNPPRDPLDPVFCADGADGAGTEAANGVYAPPSNEDQCRERSSEYLLGVLQERATRTANLERGTAILSQLRDRLGTITMEVLMPRPGEPVDLAAGELLCKRTMELQRQIAQDYRLLKQME